jgi:Cu+-exporting ATPase
MGKLNVKTKVLIMASEIKHSIEENTTMPETQAQSSEECRTVFDLEGMTCASCAMRIEKGLKKVPGVIEANVNLATEKASIVYDPTQTNLEQMVQKVEAVGYKATPQVASLKQPAQETTIDAITETSGIPTVTISQEDELSKRRQAEVIRKRNLLILGIVLTVPVVILNMFFMNRFPGENYFLLVLTTPVWAVVGWEFHRGAIKTLRHGSANMDTLVSLGSTAAYILSVVATFFPQVVGPETFYDTTALIVTLIFLGKYLEARATGQTNEAIKKLIGLQARTAHVVRGGQEVEIPNRAGADWRRTARTTWRKDSC